MYNNILWGVHRLSIQFVLTISCMSPKAHFMLFLPQMRPDPLMIKKRLDL